MLKVAITGNIASGKTTVENFLKEKYPVLDTDTIAHELLLNKDVKAEIEQAFEGFDVLENNLISRPKLSKIIFYDETQGETLRKKLESILHPLIKIEIEKFFSSQQEKGKKVAFVSIPLLFEAKFESVFDKIVLIYADDNIRVERLLTRNNLTQEEAKKRLNSQISQDEKISLADYVIYNNENLDDLLFSTNAFVENIYLV